MNGYEGIKDVDYSQAEFTFNTAPGLNSQVTYSSGKTQDTITIPRVDRVGDFTPKTVLPTRSVDPDNPEQLADLAATLENIIQDGIPECDCERVMTNDEIRGLAQAICEEIFGGGTTVFPDYKMILAERTQLMVDNSRMRAELAEFMHAKRLEDFKTRKYPMEQTKRAYPTSNSWMKKKDTQ